MSMCIKAKKNTHLQQQIAAKKEGEEKFVPLKERTTYVTVKVVGEVINQ